MPTPEPYVHDLPMRWADLDTLNHVNNVVYVDYAAESRAMLVADGQLSSNLTISGVRVEFLRPLLLSRRPVRVVSTIEPDTLTQEICVDRDGARTIFARVITRFGERTPIERHLPVGDPLPTRVRRSDLDLAGHVSITKMFELFQEGRVLFISNHLTAMEPGHFVVGRVDVDLAAPISWRTEPYQSRGWIGRIGDASVTIETELADGPTVLARSTSVLVGFDLANSRSRKFSDRERAEFTAISPVDSPCSADGS